MTSRYTKYEKLTIIYIVLMVDLLLYSYVLSLFGLNNGVLTQVIAVSSIPAWLFLVLMTARSIKWIIHFIWVYSPTKIRKKLKEYSASRKLQRAIIKEVRKEINKETSKQFSTFTKAKRK